MKISFLGGTRFIGRAAAALAEARGHDVSVLHRGKHPSTLAGVRPISVDRNDPSALCETLLALRPDVLVDTRAMTEVDAEVLALSSKVLGLPLVVLSSTDVYAQFGRLNGLSAPEPEEVVTEESPLTIPFPFRDLARHPGGPDYDKKLVEAKLRGAVEEGAKGVTVLRLPAVYGPHDYNRRFGAVVDALDSGARTLPCQGGAPLRLTHAHVTDVAHAIVLASEAIPSGYTVYNVAEEHIPTMAERAEALARFMNVSFEWGEAKEDLPPEFFLHGNLPNNFVASSRRIRDELGFREITTEACRLDDTVQWLRSSRA